MVAAAIVGAVIAGTATAVGSNAAGKAMEGATNQAINYQEQEQQLALATNASTRNLGTGADNSLASVFGYNPTTGASTGQAPNYSGFINNPGTLFATQQGQQAQQRVAGSGGNLYSSSTMATLGNLASGSALGNYNNYVNSLLQSAQIGGNAQNSSANNIVQTGQGVSNSYTNQGQALASAASGVAGGIASIGGAISGAGMKGMNTSGVGIPVGTQDAMDIGSTEASIYGVANSGNGGVSIPGQNMGTGSNTADNGFNSSFGYGQGTSNLNGQTNSPNKLLGF